MKCLSTPVWPETKADAYAIQATAAAQVELRSDTAEPRVIAAVDTDYGYAGEYLYAAAVVLTFPQFEEVEHTFAVARATFPYVPGLFYFREGPVIVEALSALKTDVDVILLASHGIAHPTRCGLACHIGLAFDRPSIGCARKLLAGQHQPVPPPKGSLQPILLYGQEVGYAYRSKENVKPIFVSPGHKCDLSYAKDIVERSLRGFRMPEPLRIAHLLATHCRRHHEQVPCQPFIRRLTNPSPNDHQAEPGRK